MNTAVATTEPLVRLSDLDEYRKALAHRLAGDWDEEKWTGFRTRYGVYGQKQPGVQMVRIKIPGGILPIDWLTALAGFNREFCKGDVHITTRQDIQTYFVPLERTAEALQYLYSRGLTTREACGNTFRNVTACALAGNCPREHVDAGVVAQQVARTWIRNPLVQHMPRKAKISISGCATDCALSPIHDVGLVAIEKDGKKGFSVRIGGGLGGQPRTAVPMLDFVTEDELPTIVETTARIHQRYSDRVNRNAARLKFVLKRFGEEKFRELWLEEYARMRGLPQRPWQPLEWREPEEASVERTPMGVVKQHDGRFAVVANPVLGNFTADQLDTIVAMAKSVGIMHVRATHDQNLVFPNIPADRVDEVVNTLKGLNIDIPGSAAERPDVVACPGTTTCRIGFTNSPGFANAVLKDAENDPTAKGMSVRISGCQNSCGQHHIGDFGFHGLAKKIDGQPAPHYQIHLGGDARAGVQPDAIAMGGPIIPARHALEALRLLRHGYHDGKQAGETVRQWAERLGKEGISALLAPIAGRPDDQLFIDWGDDGAFAGAPTLRGECAAPFASDDLLADLADDGLIRIDRHLAVNRWEGALQAAEEAVVFAARRLIHHAGQFTKDDEPAGTILERIQPIASPEVLAALDHVSAERTVALSNGRADAYREAVAVFIDTIRAICAEPDVELEAAE